MTAYYNEIDPYAAQWLRNLIQAGHIAPGIVDERSIEDVLPSDLDGFTQCHFFAGVGVWSLALRNAGWPDSRPVWTGSCPCQPFSASGKGEGFADERHLWPAFHYLIEQLRPATILGEQVASKDADPWIDLVHADVEALGYAFGCVPFPSAGIGAPHIRDRAFWLADSDSRKRQQQPSHERPAGLFDKAHGPTEFLVGLGDSRAGFGRLDNADDARLEGLRSGHQAARRQRKGSVRPVAQAGELGGMADAELQQRQDGQSAVGHVDATGGREQSAATTAGLRSDSGPGPTNGIWRNADWLFCRDGKWRAVEPGTFPLAASTPSRVGRLRAYGNSINAEAAETFIRAAMTP